MSKLIILKRKEFFQPTLTSLKLCNIFLLPFNNFKQYTCKDKVSVYSYFLICPAVINDMDELLY